MKPPLSPELKARIMEAALSTPSRVRSEEQTRGTVLLVLAFAAGALVFVSVGGVQIAGRAPGLVLGTGLGSGGIALATAALIAARGGSMLPPARWKLLSAALGAPCLLLAWKLTWSARFAGALDAWPARPGLRCLALTLAIALLPLLALLFRRRGTTPARPRSTGLALGAATGLAAAFFVDLWCPVAFVSHYLLGHVLPIFVLAAVGAAVAARLLPPRGR